MSKKTIIIILLALVAITGQAQTSFDPDEGCLNVIDISYAQGIGEYGDEGVSANYLHEKFINECLSIGAGIVSTHYFFLDRKFSPFVNLRVGGFAMFNAKKVGTNEKYSLSKDKQSFSLFVSPSVGVKMHITPNIGIMASINDEAYLVNAFDTSRNDYRSKLIHSWGISVGICFQIKGW